jgi:hypothetical protein
MRSAPSWWSAFAEFTAVRRCPGGTIAILRETSRLLITEPDLAPRHLLALITTDGTPATQRALDAFFTSQRMTFARNDVAHKREQARDATYLRPIGAALSEAVASFHRAQMDEQQRLQRTGRRTLNDITLTARLRVLRDLAAYLNTRRHSTGWAEVTTTDLEGFLTQDNNRHQRTYVLRRFFAWAKGRKLILVDPTRRLALGPQPGFVGTVLDMSAQRTLFRRWTDTATPPHERLIGLLALLHAGSNMEIRELTVDDIDAKTRTIAFINRPFPTPLDPATWDALQACLGHREAMQTLNPHVIVTRVTSSRTTAANSSYLSRALAPTGTTPAVCRQTRLTQLVTDLDPKLAATALGMNGGGLVRYLADNVARDRLHRSGHRH